MPAAIIDLPIDEIDYKTVRQPNLGSGGNCF